MKKVKNKVSVSKEIPADEQRFGKPKMQPGAAFEKASEDRSKKVAGMLKGKRRFV